MNLTTGCSRGGPTSLRARGGLRRLRHDAAFVLIGALCTLLAFPAHLFAQSVDLGIVDDASYAAAIDAIGKAEYVRYDYVNNPRPRVAASATALMVFATRNPLASEQQLTDFINAFAAALNSYHPGDPELRRGANFMPGMRYTTPLLGVAGLEGMDTDLGDETAALLGMDVSEPFDFNSLETRMVDFEKVRERSLANAPELLNLLALGLLGRDLDANDDPALASVMQAFLETEGFEPVPDGIDDERFSFVNAGLAQVPATYAEYLTAITVPGGSDVPRIWSSIESQFLAIASNTDAQLADLADADANGDGVVDVNDISYVLFRLGNPC